MISPFQWIRRKAAEALIQGMADGAAAVTPEGEQPPATADELRALFASGLPKALPAKAEEPEEKPQTGRKK